MSRPLLSVTGVACLLLAGVLAPPAAPAAQAGPSLTPRSAPPAMTLAIVKVIGVGDTPVSIAVDDLDDTIYVANQGSGNVSVIDGRTGAPIGTITVGTVPSGIAVDQDDDTVYVTNQFSNSVSVINGRSSLVSSTIGVGSQPVGVAVNQDDDTVYVTNQGDDSISVISGRASVVASTIGVGSQPVGVAVNQDDDTVYVVNSISDSVTVISGGAAPVVASTVSTGNDPWAAAVNQDDDTVYVTKLNDSTVSVINARTSTVSSTLVVGQDPYGIAVDLTDDTVYVANLASETLSVITGRTATVSSTISVAGGPFGVAVDNSGANQGLVYLTNSTFFGLSVIGRASPSLVTTSGDAGTSVTVNVDAPQVTYEVDPDTVQSVSFGGTAVTPTALAGDAWQVTAPAGTPGTTVAVTVTFRGGLTASAGTFTYNPAPPPPPPVFPHSAPQNVTATPGDAQAGLTWFAPASSGSFPITTYEVRSTPTGRTCLVSARTCTITGLTNGTTYTFEARALNGAGWGPWSTPSNTVTPVAPPPPSITITGSRGTGADRRIVFVTGTSTGLDAQQVRAHVKLHGQANYRPGRFVAIGTDGTFTWQRTTGKKTYIYFTSSGIQSNRIIIPAAGR